MWGQFVNTCEILRFMYDIFSNENVFCMHFKESNGAAESLIPRSIKRHIGCQEMRLGLYKKSQHATAQAGKTRFKGKASGLRPITSFWFQNGIKNQKY